MSTKPSYDFNNQPNKKADKEQTNQRTKHYIHSAKIQKYT